MALELMVKTFICTFHLATVGEKVAATERIPVTVTEYENGGFVIAYDPEEEESEKDAHACKSCASAIIGGLIERKEWVKEKIIDAVKAEASYAEVDDTPDDYTLLENDIKEDEYDLGMDEDDAEAVGEHIMEGKAINRAPDADAASVGLSGSSEEILKDDSSKDVTVTPITSDAVRITPKPDTARKVSIVSNPKPEADAEDEEYEPDMSWPKGPERQAIRLYWKNTEEARKFKVPGMQGRVADGLLRMWRTSDEYFKWLAGQKSNV